MDDKQKIAQIDNNDATTTIRYQLSDHLGSSSLELDENADVISYEEYYPFGTSSYRSGRSEAEVSQKRYKYVMKELDNETGLYYYGMRYYASWLCRFISVDPLQHKYPYYTPFQYAGNQPVTFYDLDGLETADNDLANVRNNVQNNSNLTLDNSLYQPGKISLYKSHSNSTTNFIQNHKDDNIPLFNPYSNNYTQIGLRSCMDCHSPHGAYYNQFQTERTIFTVSTIAAPTLYAAPIVLPTLGSTVFGKGVTGVGIDYSFQVIMNFTNNDFKFDSKNFSVVDWYSVGGAGAIGAVTVPGFSSTAKMKTIYGVIISDALLDVYPSEISSVNGIIGEPKSTSNVGFDLIFGYFGYKLGDFVPNNLRKSANDALIPKNYAPLDDAGKRQARQIYKFANSKFFDYSINIGVSLGTSPSGFINSYFKNNQLDTLK